MPGGTEPGFLREAYGDVSDSPNSGSRSGCALRRHHFPSRPRALGGFPESASGSSRDLQTVAHNDYGTDCCLIGAAIQTAPGYRPDRPEPESNVARTTGWKEIENVARSLG